MKKYWLNLDFSGKHSLFFKKHKIFRRLYLESTVSL